jgi:hypothetical protein
MVVPLFITFDLISSIWFTLFQWLSIKFVSLFDLFLVVLLVDLLFSITVFVFDAGCCSLFFVVRSVFDSPIMVVGFWCLWSVVFYFFNTFGSTHFGGV